MKKNRSVNVKRAQKSVLLKMLFKSYTEKTIKFPVFESFEIPSRVYNVMVK